MSAPPLSRVTGPQSRTWLPSAPVMAHVPPAPLWEAIDQCTNGLAPPGNGSWMVAPSASPAPLLCRVMVKPIGEPALTLAASCTLVSLRLAQLTASEAVAEPEPSLVL